jgi:CelD/BcsL family acetyltransferase involved in cellulose biosynthesis
VWAFVRGRPRSGLPLAVLSAPTHPTSADATPVIDAGRVEPVLAAMIAAIEASPLLPKLIAIRALNDGGPVMAAFRRVMAARRSPAAALARAVRPRLTCNLDPKGYFARTMSGGRRRKLGQLRRRLAGRGRLDLHVHRGTEAVAAALDRFLALEASGWKGSIGHALARTAPAFSQAAVPALAAEGCAEIWELSLDRAAVSMAIILRQGAGAFDWKIAYDERHGDCSPGVLLAQDYTAEFLQDPAVAFADSCAPDDSGLLGPLWTARQPMVDVILDVRPGGSLAFTAWSAFERCHRWARRRAKAPVELVRSHLRHMMRKHAQSTAENA